VDAAGPNTQTNQGQKSHPKTTTGHTGTIERERPKEEEEEDCAAAAAKASFFQG